MRKLTVLVCLIASLALPARGAGAVPCSALIHIGDSITVAMRRYLEADYARYGFSNVIISAGNGRSILYSSGSDNHSGLEAVAYWKARTPEGRCWVIALGTNDLISTNKAERIDKMIGALGSDRAMWVNTYVNSRTRPKYNGLNAYAWNALLEQRHLNILDWALIVQPSWLSKDGIHYTTEGSRNRSAIITECASGTWCP